MENDTDKSLFNSGLAKLERIDKIRQTIFYFTIQDDMENIYDCLLSWRNEMDYGIHNNIELLQEADKYEHEIETWMKTKGLQSDFIRNKMKQYNRFLGRIEQELGLGMPNAPSALDAAGVM